MARLNQCKDCKDYQSNLNLCTREWKELCFDDTDCKFKFDNIEDSASSTSESEDFNENIHSRVAKRGSIRSGTASDNKVIKEAMEMHAPKIKHSSSSISKRVHPYYIAIFFIIIILVLGGFGISCYLKNEEKEQEKSHVNYLLDEIQQDKTLNSIKMISHHYEGDTLLVNYFAIPSIAKKIYKDSLKNEFQNMVLLHHDKWKELLNSVVDKQSIVIATFNRYHHRQETSPDHTSEVKSIYEFEDVEDSTTITLAEINAFIDNPDLRKNAVAVFANRKLFDIEEYVNLHYANTSMLKMHSVTLDKDFVRVALSFDDSRSRIGSTLLDSMNIDPNFTDKVGERGSILREIFSICSRTHRGFTIEYIGSQKGTHHILSWNYDRAMKFKSLFNFGTNPYDETNQVGVTLINENKD